MVALPKPAEPADDIFRPRFEEAFDAHHADVLAFAVRRVPGRAAAEDVVAETFAVVWRRRDVIPEPPLAWLYEIARKVIANQRRSDLRRTRLRERLSSEPETTAGGRDPARVVAGREAVIAAFSALSESDKEVLRLLVWEGLDTKTAARVLDCTPAALRVRLYRARRELTHQLESQAAEGITGTTPRTAEETR